MLVVVVGKQYKMGPKEYMILTYATFSSWDNALMSVGLIRLFTVCSSQLLRIWVHPLN